MNLKEYQGKELFKKYNIPIPRGRLITSIQPDPSKLAKAQVLEGKRKKRGLIRSATEQNLKKLFKYTQKVLLEERLKIEKEFYLSLAVSREEKRIIIIFSEEGGIDIEEAKRIIKLPYNRLSQFPQKEFLSIIKSMYRLMRNYHALLVEINPLALSGGKLIAVDAKITLDDNVKHPEFEQELSPLEKEASEFGLSYVDLEGNIGVIGNGAGLVMATLDVIAYFGGKASNFLDLGGGASPEKMEKALEIVHRKKPQVIFINVFGGITRCDLIARGIINYKNNYSSSTPLIIRMIGTGEEDAKRSLLKHDVEVYFSMEECVKKAIEYVRSSK